MPNSLFLKDFTNIEVVADIVNAAGMISSGNFNNILNRKLARSMRFEAKIKKRSDFFRLSNL
ncbi:MAG TPA: hypothetical protein VF941_05595 [Clostridia bacterium]